MHHLPERRQQARVILRAFQAPDSEPDERVVEAFAPPYFLPRGGVVAICRRVDAVRDDRQCAFARGADAQVARAPGVADLGGQGAKAVRESVKQHAPGAAFVDAMCGADEHRHRHEQAHEAREHVRVEHVGVHDIRLEKLDDPCQAKDAA